MRALIYRHQAIRAGLLALAALGGLAVVLPLAALVLGGNRATALALLGTGGLAAMLVVIGAIVLGLVVPRRRFARDTALARWVGSRHPPVASDLLSSVELAAAPARPGAPSPELVAALLETTSRQLETIDPRVLLPAYETARARTWVLLAIAANVALIAAIPTSLARGWRQLVSVPKAPFDGAQLSDVPLVSDLGATLTFPAYAHRAPLELPSSSGDLRGLPGTHVVLRARVLVPAASVELVVEPPIGGTGAPHTVSAKLDGDQLSAELTIERAARYRFAVTSMSGTRAIEAIPRAIDTETDQAPSVQLLAPGEPLDVSNLRRVELAYTIDDDFGVTTAELVWEAGKDRGRKPIALGPAASRAQGKLMWDIAEIQVPSGGEVRYWIEAKDNDTVGGPNVGRSRELHLKVISPRERHEETLARQQQLAEKLLGNLGARLTGPGDDVAARENLSRQLHDAIGELAAIGAAYEKDPHASELMRKSLSQMRDRLDRLSTFEQRLLVRGGKAPAGRFAGIDPRLVAELEDDTISLADWLDRERVEGLLDISDEIAAHQKRLADLLAQYARTKDPRLLDEIDREMRALDHAFAELDKHRQGMPEDVLDQYVQRDAVQPQQGSSCIEVCGRWSTRGGRSRPRPSSRPASSCTTAPRPRWRARCPSCAATSSATSRRSSTRS